jgi:hypothetical protein
MKSPFIAIACEALPGRSRQSLEQNDARYRHDEAMAWSDQHIAALDELPEISPDGLVRALLN